MGLKATFLNTAYLTFAHNEYAIAFFMGALIAMGLLFYRPSRYATLLLVGFITLLLGFEYNKHILEGLQNQTLDSLALNAQEIGAKTLLLRTFQKILPVMFFIVGWGSIFLAIVTRGLKSTDKAIS